MSEFDKQEIARLEKENAQLKEQLETPVKGSKKKVSKYTREELFDMIKSEQVELIKNLGHEKIPKKEADRVDLILELTA